jgi:hypothetical protein
MNKARLNIAVSKLVGNNGQLDWLPKNPRQWTAVDVERTKRSIDRDPDFLEDRPLLVVPAESGKGERYIVFAGNLRLKACKDNGVKTAPAVIYFPESDEDRETVKRRAMLDNGSFGSWDYDELANNWDDLPLVDLGIPAWEPGDGSDLGLSTEGREGAEGYDEFVDKFVPKLTTDDCYTPPAVYDIIRDFVDQQVAPLKGRTIVRPFVPGGDYENYDYPKDCVVLDNPPFSLYSKIVRFYLERGIDFFLFGPSLTLFVSNADACFVVANIPIKYENGAVVSTGFVTNMVPGVRIWVEHSMRDAVIKIQDDAADLAAYELPNEVVTSARLGKICSRGADLKLAAKDCFYVHDLDGMKEAGKGLYGGGYLLSAAAAAAAAETIKAMEQKETIKVALSERERAIVAGLG